MLPTHFQLQGQPWQFHNTVSSPTCVSNHMQPRFLLTTQQCLSLKECEATTKESPSTVYPYHDNTSALVFWTPGRYIICKSNSC